MALHHLPSELLRTACRQRIEACELWLRRLIHEQLKPAYGDNYIEEASISDQAIFNAQIRRHVASRLASDPHRYRRPIDTLQLDHLINVICKTDVFKRFFSTAFRSEFPLGNEHLRSVMSKLVPIRNALSHANPLSIADAERVLCYCSDVISSLARHYAEIGMNQEFNAPLFTRFSDSVGNVEYIQDPHSTLNFRNNNPLQCGQSVRFEAEVDSNFPPDEYQVLWQVANTTGGESGTGTSFELRLLPRHVNQDFQILVSLTSKQEWHRLGNHDARFVLRYKVLPPP